MIKELAAAREKVAELERTVETKLHQELSVLHEHYGFPDVKSFLKAVKSAARGVGWKKAGRLRQAAAVPKTRKRAVITAAIRARVKKLVSIGKSARKSRRPWEFPCRACITSKKPLES